jgi:signal peptidase I
MATVPHKSNTVTQSTPTPASSTPAQPRDAFREVLETIVFVVALVLMLKLFVVEAFVIPTGSMAETLYGYQKIAECPDCGYHFPVNASSEVEPPDGLKRSVNGACCPNCRYRWTWAPAEVRTKVPTINSGDRVLVHKAMYQIGDPQPGDVVVFKFPVDPQVNYTAQNYIKRLWGLGGQTIGIHRGDLYRTRSLEYPADARDPESGKPLYPRPDDPRRLWESAEANGSSKVHPAYLALGQDFTYHNVEAAVERFEASRLAGFPEGANGFEMIRKADAQALSMRRIVYDNDHQSKILAGTNVPPRWTVDEGGWIIDSAQTPKVFMHKGDTLGWVRYWHRISHGSFPFKDNPPVDWVSMGDGWHEGLFPPSLITNFLGYNAGYPTGGRENNGEYWVPDLMLECVAKVSGPADEVVLELSKGINRFQARFANGAVTLIRIGPGGKELASRPTPITRAGTYALRFANVDARLRVWVNGRRIDFGTEGDYSPWAGESDALGALTGGAFLPRPDGHTLQNDILAPARIAAKGSVEVRNVVLWEDTFYTPSDRSPAEGVDTYYVQPGHYFCLGDNSGQSSDSRVWGLVPERLMLGKAVFIFAPFFPFVPWVDNRVGFIR